MLRKKEKEKKSKKREDKERMNLKYKIPLVITVLALDIFLLTDITKSVVTKESKLGQYELIRPLLIPKELEVVQTLEQSKEEEREESVEPFSQRALEDFIYNVPYHLSYASVEDELILVVNPQEVEDDTFQTKRDGMIAIASVLVREYTRFSNYLSLDGISIQFSPTKVEAGAKVDSVSISTDELKTISNGTEEAIKELVEKHLVEC